MSTVTILSNHEARVLGRKFLYKANTLFEIRDRESDPDYNEDEEWMFEAWCGPEIQDRTILSVWNSFRTPVPVPIPMPIPIPVPSPTPESVIPQKSSAIWIPIANDQKMAIHLTTGPILTILCMDERMNLWMSELSQDDLAKKADESGYVVSPEEFQERLLWALDCKQEPPISVWNTDQSYTIHFAVESNEEYSFVIPFQIPFAPVPMSIRQMLFSQMPPKSIPQNLQTTFATLEVEEEPINVPVVNDPAPNIHEIIKNLRKSKKITFRGRQPPKSA